MTCIAAVIDNGSIWMGADSAGVGGLRLVARRDPKIYRVKDFLFGFTSSFRMGQILGYSFQPPEMTVNQTVEQYMATTFINALRQALKDGGYARTRDGEDQGGTFLVGYRGRIFEICDDFQVGENLHPYAAVGCGMDLALGSLFSTQGMPSKSRLEKALSAAETFSAGVRGPFIFEVLEPAEK